MLLHFEVLSLNIAASLVLISFPASSQSTKDTHFPYEYWKPKSSLDGMTPSSYRAEATSRKYGFYYGESAPTAKSLDSGTWHVPPIKIPKDIVGDVREKTTLKPPRSLTTYPSSLSPQYGRHPGATERPPLYSHSERNIPKAVKPKTTFSVSNFKPIRHKRPVQKLPAIPYNNIPYSRVQTTKVPAKRIEIFAIDRNQEPPPHAFYAINDSSNLKVGILHKNKTHAGYVSPPNSRRSHNSSDAQRQQRYPRDKYNILDYSRYRYQKDFNHPQATRKKYNENLIELIRRKVERQPVSINRINEPLEFHNEQKMQPSQNFNPQIEKPILKARYAYAPRPETFNNFNSSRRVAYKTPYRYHSDRPSNIKPIYVRSPRPISVDRIVNNYFPPKYNTDNRITTRIKNFFTEVWKRNPKPAPNAYPENKKRVRSHHHYYYDDRNENLFSKPQTKSIMERIAGIQYAPATLVIPGGLAAIGLGIAAYYLNYVWYPTPVVTARLLQFIRSFTDQDMFDDLQENEFGKMLEAFRSIEKSEFSPELSSDSCKDRLVCQLHREIPQLWDVTQIISPFLGFQKNDSAYEQSLKTYLETARKGTQHNGTCSSLYEACQLPYVPLKSLLELVSGVKRKEGQGQSRVL